MRPSRTVSTAAALGQVRQPHFESRAASGARAQRALAGDRADRGEPETIRHLRCDTAAVVTTDSKGAFAIYRVHLDESIDEAEATDRLEVLLDAIEAARRAPAAPFQKAGWNIASTEDASMPGHLEVTRDIIDEYVGSEKYSVSSEALFYGETPDAEMLCSAESPWRAVWRHLGRASGWSGRMKPSYSGTKKTLPGSTEKITGYVLK